jgi:UDP-glucose 4-epimerase
MNVLVCGGAGYIGSSVARMLEARGDRVVVFDNLGTGFRSAVNHPRIKFVEGNLLNEKDLYLVFKQHDIDAVCHLALRSPYVSDQINVALCYRNNLTGTMNLLDTMRNNNVSRLVFASSALVYGNNNGVALTEEEPVNPADGFASTVSSVEQMLGHFNQAYGLNSVSLRFFNASGVDSSDQNSELLKTRTSEILDILYACQTNNNSEFKVSGDDHPMKDGTVDKDYLHVVDICRAHVKALDYLLEDNIGSHIFNLGAGRAYSVNEFIATAEKITRNKARISRVKPGSGPSVQTLSSKRANKTLKWQPSYKLEEIMQSDWDLINRPQPGHSSAEKTPTRDAGIDEAEITKPSLNLLGKAKSWHYRMSNPGIDTIKVK